MTNNANARRATPAQLAYRDVIQGITSAHIWSTLAWQEIKHRYRRSTLGPFWLTLSMGALIGAMAPLYGTLFGQEISSYFPYLAIGIILWQLVASVLNDSGNVFIAAGDYITQIRMPLTIHVMRMVWRNVIVFAHNCAVIVVLLVLFPPASPWPVLLAIPGIAALFLNAIWVGVFIGLLSARFRDIPLITSMVVQIGFFLTPVLWKREMLGPYSWAADFNPVYHFIEAVRGPLLGHPSSMHSWLVIAGVTIIGTVVTFAFFSRYRSRVAYWM